MRMVSGGTLVKQMEVDVGLNLTIKKIPPECLSMANMYLKHTPCTKQESTKGLRKRPLVP